MLETPGRRTDLVARTPRPWTPTTPGRWTAPCRRRWRSAAAGTRRTSRTRSTNPITAKPGGGDREPDARRPVGRRTGPRAGARDGATSDQADGGRAGWPARPAAALKPRAAGFWKYRLSRYIRALMVPAPIRIAMVDPTRTRLRSSARSSIGTATRRSTATNATPGSTDRRAGSPSVATDVQPQSLPLLTARMSGHQGQRDQHGAGEVDGPRPVRVASTRSPLAAVSGMHDHGHDRRRPRTAPASRSRRRAHRPAGARAAAPTAAAAPHSETARSCAVALVRHREQAQAAGQDGRARRRPG